MNVPTWRSNTGSLISTGRQPDGIHRPRMTAIGIDISELGLWSNFQNVVYEPETVVRHVRLCLIRFADRLDEPLELLRSGGRTRLVLQLVKADAPDILCSAMNRAGFAGGSNS